MIQRKQTLWLLVAGLSAFLTFIFPFYNGSKLVREHTQPDRSFLGDGTFPVFVFTLFTFMLILVAIFLYKNRKLQFRVGIAALALSVLVIYFYFTGIKTHFVKGNILLTSVFAFAVPVLIFMALRGIRHDEKLVKSLDKLR